MKSIFQPICDSIVLQYKQDKNVLGIMLCGSVARNISDQYSDIDIYILLKNRGKLSRRNFIIKGMRVDIIFNTLNEAHRYLLEEKTSFRRMTSHMIAHGLILFQRNTAIKKIQSMADKNIHIRFKPSSTEILMHKYSIDDFWGEVQRDLKNKDYVAFGLDGQLLMNNILELFLKLQGHILPQPNETKQTIKSLNKNFAKLVENFYTTSGHQKKLYILSQLIKNIYKIAHGLLPDTWSLKD